MPTGISNTFTGIDVVLNVAAGELGCRRLVQIPWSFSQADV